MSVCQKTDQLLTYVAAQLEHVKRLKGFACARFDFVARDEDELSFKDGDRIEIIEFVNNDWIRGSLHKREGIFPAAFVSVEEYSPDGMSSSRIFLFCFLYSVFSISFFLFPFFILSTIKFFPPTKNKKENIFKYFAYVFLLYNFFCFFLLIYLFVSGFIFVSNI